MCRSKHTGGRRCTPHKAYQAVSNSRRRVQRGEEKLAALVKKEEAGEPVTEEQKKKVQDKIEADRKAYEADMAHYREAAYGMDDSLGDEDKVPAAPTAASEAPAAEDVAVEEPAKEEPAKEETPVAEEKVTENTPGAVSVADLKVGDKIHYFNKSLVATSTFKNPLTGEETTEEVYAGIDYTGEVVERRDHVGDIGMSGVKIREANGDVHYVNDGQHVVRTQGAPKERTKVPSKTAEAEETETTSVAPNLPVEDKEKNPAPVKAAVVNDKTKKTTKPKTKKAAKAAAPAAAAPVVAENVDTSVDLDDIDGPSDVDLDDASLGGSFEDWAKSEGFSDILDEEKTTSSSASTPSNDLFPDDDEDLGYDDAEGWDWRGSDDY